MPNVLDIRRRIRSVINTRQITKAMKTVSAAKLRRAQESALAARPYSQMLTNVLKSLVARADIYDPITGEPRHPLLAERPEKTILLIVVTGDKGLAGAFNTNILKVASKFIESNADKNIDLECIGRKGRDFMRRRFPTAPQVGTAGVSPAGNENGGPRAARVQIVADHVGVLGKVEFTFASNLGATVVDRFCRGEIDGVYVLYNEFKSVIAQRLIVEKLLPIREIGATDVRMAEEAAEEERKRRVEAAKTAGVGIRPVDTKAVDEAAARFAASQIDYIYEQPPDKLFSAILPKYIGIEIFHALLESVAAEHAARMTAMDAATNNASDMIDSLTLVMNRARQAKITKEIIEIVSGAAAL
ncbi:MAG TPA: F0F1 ATP synthase subunit gamma [Terriglobales bacterium]|nr:F0F1 ATP synthase subunit gamma [Terriglobales bacterium]